jgi:HSP20 family protein
VPDDDWERYLAHFGRSGKRPTILFTHTPSVTAGWAPSLDMFETDDAVVVVLDLAGVDPEHTEVQAEPNRLTIRGIRRPRPITDERCAYHTLEIPYGRFERTLRVPPGIDPDAAQAHYRDGLLQITLPKTKPHEVRISSEG